MPASNILLIDGHNFLYRAFYGVPQSATLPNGTQVNAVYGFFALLRNILSWQKYEKLYIIFDTETSIQNKLAINPEYKQNRTNPDAEKIYTQLEIIQQILKNLNIAYIQHPNHEADDIIGSLANLFTTQSNTQTSSQNANQTNLQLKPKTQVHIASNDHDFYQLINASISIIHGRHGKFVQVNNQEFAKNFDFSPTNYLDYVSLKGDPSDNIGGIAGIGHKIAHHLVSKHSTIENIYQNFGKLKPRHQNLLKNKQDFLISTRQFLKINTKIFLQEPTSNQQNQTRNKHKQINHKQDLIQQNYSNPQNINIPAKMGQYLKEYFLF